MDTKPTRRRLMGAASMFATAATASSPTEQTPALPPAQRGRTTFFKVTNFGAVPDGRTVNTPALQRAIDACSASGGGTVYVPPGVYISGALRLASNLVLHLEAGATLKGSSNLDDYILAPASERGRRPRRGGLVNAEKAENITITGSGVIDGNGPAFLITSKTRSPMDWDRARTRQKQAFMDPALDTEGPWETAPRPGNVVRLTGCRNVRFSGVTLQNSPSWTLHLVRCDDVGLFGININSLASDRRMPNDDGLDISGCRNMRMSGCVIRTGDDSIAVFGTDGLVVDNCILESRSSGIRVGYGAHATDGNIRNCVFTNLTISGNRGICVNVRGAYAVENVLFSNIAIRTRLHTGHWWGKAEPIHLSAVTHPNTKSLGHIRNVEFTDISAESEHGIVLWGSEQSVIRDVGFRNVNLVLTESPLHKTYGGNFDMRMAKDMAEALFQHDIPALFARYVDGLSIDGFRVDWRGELLEYFTHAIEAERFRNLEIAGFCGRQAHAGASTAVIALREGEGVTVRNCRALQGTGTFLVLDKVTDQRLFANNNLARAREAVVPRKTQFLFTGNRLNRRG